MGDYGEEVTLTVLTVTHEINLRNPSIFSHLLAMVISFMLGVSGCCDNEIRDGTSSTKIDQ